MFKNITAYDICHAKMDTYHNVTRIKMHFTQNPSSIWYLERISIKFIVLFMDRCKNVKERKIYVIAHVTLKSQIMYTVYLYDTYQIYTTPTKRNEITIVKAHANSEFETELTKLKQTKNKNVFAPIIECGKY